MAGFLIALLIIVSYLVGIVALVLNHLRIRHREQDFLTWVWLIAFIACAVGFCLGFGHWHGHAARKDLEIGMAVGVGIMFVTYVTVLSYGPDRTVPRSIKRLPQ